MNTRNFDPNNKFTEMYIGPKKIAKIIIISTTCDGSCTF